MRARLSGGRESVEGGKSVAGGKSVKSGMSGRSKELAQPSGTAQATDRQLFYVADCGL